MKNAGLDGKELIEGVATLVRKSKFQCHPDDFATKGWERWVVRFDDDGSHSDDVYERILAPEDILPKEGGRRAKGDTWRKAQDDHAAGAL